MKIKAGLIAVALTVLPTLAMAECAWGHKQQATMTCAEGSVYDAEAGKCVVIASS